MVMTLFMIPTLIALITTTNVAHAVSFTDALQFYEKCIVDQEKNKQVT